MGTKSQQAETFTDEGDPGLLETGAHWYPGVAATLRWVQPAYRVSASSAWIVVGSATSMTAPDESVTRIVLNSSMEALLFSSTDDLSPTSDKGSVLKVTSVIPDLTSQRVLSESPDTDEPHFPMSLLTGEAIARRIAQYEDQHGMTSEEFLRRRREGTAPDTFDTMVWATLLDYR